MRNGLSPREHARITRLIAENGDVINHARTQLATNFDTPAQRIVGIACGQMNCSRLDWEKIVAVQNGWDYESVRTLVKIANAFGISVAALFDAEPSGRNSRS